MKLGFLAFVASVMLSIVSFVPLSAGAATHLVAPADEYFGHQRLSILGMRNMLRDAMRGARSGAPTDNVVNTARAVEDGLRDWQARYELDPWLPRYIYQLDALYHHIDSDEAHERAEAVDAWLVHRYPRSPYARSVRDGNFEIARI